MKKNLLKLSIYGVCAVFVATSCLETEELDSVKAMREAKADKLQAEADAAVLKNAYDSAKYKLDLSVATAQSQYNIADYNFQQQMLKLTYSRDSQLVVDQMAINIQNSKTNLISAQVAFVNSQATLFTAKQNYLRDSVNASAKNQALVNLYNDYFAYYNGGTLSSGVTINRGIFTLRGDILAEKGTLLTALNNQANDIEIKANLILGYRDNIRTDSLSIVAKQKTITIYNGAKTSADYTKAIDDITSLVNSAEVDFVAKQNARVILEDDKAKAYNADTAATNTYNRNLARKNKANNDMKNLLTLVGVNTFNELVQEQARVASDLTDKSGVYNIWATQFTTATNNLAASKNTKNQAQVRKDAADAVVASVTAAGGTPTSAQLTEQTNATQALSDANTDLAAKQSTYDNVKAGYDPAKTAYDNAKIANDSIVARRARYDGFSAIYDEADGKVASLLAAKDAKKADYEAALKQYNEALTAENIAKNNYVSYKACKTTLEGISLISDASVKISQLDDKIAALQKDIATLQNDINDYNLQISRVNKADYTYEDAIKTSNAKIAMYTSLLTEYETNAAAIKAKIDAY
ncbi:MAG TPA: hypothetical protein PK252_10885 [Bacteroidales bacterium]|nr:hypothetical protein [Bacteroidales bacterium]